MMELIVIIIATVLVLAIVAIAIVGTVATTLPWFAWVLIVAIICGFQYLRHTRKEKKNKNDRAANVSPAPFSDHSYYNMIDQTIEKELAEQAAKEKAREIRNSNPKMIKVKNKNDHFNLLN